MELCLPAVLVLLKIKFGHAQISVPKTGIPMLKTAYINIFRIVTLISLALSLSNSM